MSSSYIKIFLLSRQLAYEVSHEGSPAMRQKSLTAFLAAQKRIGPLEPGREFDCYQAVFEAASSIASVDAFYLCHFAQSRMLFPYQTDDGILEGPDEFALGSGPTSHVIRTNSRYMMKLANRSIQRSGVMFGSEKLTKIDVSCARAGTIRD